MANISTGDVRTYINELIAKEFGSIDREDNTAAECRRTTASRYNKAQNRKGTKNEENWRHGGDG